MLPPDELEKIALDLESDRVERKESLASGVKEKVAQAICAFANDLPNHRKPGYIFIGLTDTDAQPSGVTIDDELLKNLASIRSDGNILPLPFMVVERATIKGANVAVVEVHPSGDTPVYCYGQARIRVGPRRAIASRDEERILREKRQAGDVTFDRKGVVQATTTNLDVAFFRDVYLPSALAPDVLEENGRTLEEQLAALHLLSPDGYPTNASLILMGKDPRAWLPGFYVQFVRYDGTSLTSPILDQKEIDGTLTEVIRRLDELMSVNIRIETRVEGQSVEEQNPDYPLAALQQITRNAVLHRSYEINSPVFVYWFSDRIEIHSPGGLYGRVTEENFGTPGGVDHRNPLLAEGMKVLGFVQRFGMGISLARQRCTENGNRLDFAFAPSLVLATIGRRP